VRFMTELVTLGDFAGSVYATDRVAGHAEDLGRLRRAYALPLKMSMSHPSVCV
jgi:hypothetical protein